MHTYRQTWLDGTVGQGLSYRYSFFAIDGTVISKRGTHDLY